MPERATVWLRLPGQRKPIELQALDCSSTGAALKSKIRDMEGLKYEIIRLNVNGKELTDKALLGSLTNETEVTVDVVLMIQLRGGTKGTSLDGTLESDEGNFQGQGIFDTTAEQLPTSFKFDASSEISSPWSDTMFFLFYSGSMRKKDKSRRIQRPHFPGEHLVGDELLSVLALLPWHDLGTCQYVSRSWRDTLNVGDAATHLWAAATKVLWSTKVYVPQYAAVLLKSSPKAALRQSLEDAKRQCITLEELTSFEWDFRFKRFAGPWTNLDPWWQGGPPRRVRFIIDEARWDNRTLAHEGEMEWIGGEWSNMPWRFTALEDHPMVMWQWPDVDWEVGAVNGHAASQPAWRIVQVSQCPGELIMRAKNWGWIMHSTCAVYTNFPLPLKDEQDEGELSDRLLKSRVEPWQWQATEDYIHDVIQAGHENDDEEDQDDFEQGQLGEEGEESQA